MKVAIATMEYGGDPGHGGIGTYVHYLARGLKELGHEVHIICNSAMRNDTTIEDGIHIYRCKLEELERPYLQSLLPNVSFALCRLLPLWRRMIQLSEEVDFDISDVADHLATGLWNGLSEVLPMVVRLQTPFFLLQELGTNNIAPTIDSWLLGAMEKHCLRQANAVVSVSEATARMVSGLCPSLGKRSLTLPNPISCSDVPAKASYEQQSDAFRILCPGRLEKRKGTSVLVEALPTAMKTVANLRIDFAGADTLENGCSVKSTLLDLARSSNSQSGMEFLGPMPNSWILSRLASYDAVVLPSLFDNAPLACVEAMSAGMPIIGTDFGGMPEYLGEGTRGLIVPAGNVDRLAEAIVKLAHSQDLRQTLGTAARAYASTACDYRRIAEASVQLYEDILQERQTLAVTPQERSKKLSQALTTVETVIDLIEAKGREIQDRLHLAYDQGFSACLSERAAQKL